MGPDEIEEVAKRIHQNAEAWEMAVKACDQLGAMEIIGRLSEILRDMRRITKLNGGQVVNEEWSFNEQ